MRLRRNKPLILWGFLIASLVTGAHTHATSDDVILQRLAALEQNQRRLEGQLAERDARIMELEQRLGIGTPEGQLQSVAVVPRAGTADTGTPAPMPVAASPDSEPGFGRLNPGGAGYRLAETQYGTLNFSAWTYVRYLNQKGLDDSYTDSFGREFDIDIRNDFQVNKVNLTFNGWVYDPDFRWLLYTWTSNTSQGESAQVVVAGNLKYRFNDAVDVGFGIDALPGTRSTTGNFPYWIKVDHRTMGDDFFRPSYTTGMWSAGKLGADMRYKVMVGNNLSQLGVNAGRLGEDLDTFSGRLDWMPTTGEFGPGRGFDDFDMHTDLATLFGIAGTYSVEDPQSQPGTEDINNSQIRLSDGTRIFQPGAFDTDGRITEATYQMLAMDAGMKYRGFSLMGEYYWRWVDDLKTEGDIPVDDLFDHGFQLQTSYMFVPKTLQGYLAGSKIFGEYGEPWDTAIGVNWYPFKQRLLRVNGELLYMKDSPIGYSSIPYQVGGDGVVFHTNLEMKF
jgi:hypothetical protein